MPVGAGDKLVSRALSVCHLQESVAKTANYWRVWLFFPLSGQESFGSGAGSCWSCLREEAGQEQDSC